MGVLNKIVGIDPDKDKSGYAEAIDGKIVTLECYSFFELLGVLMTEPIDKVYIEAGWLNNHSESAKKAAYRAAQQAKGNKIQTAISVASKAGKDIGANAETGRKIAEMCEHLNIEYELIRPTQSKIKDYKVFNQITGWKGRSNQEKRDAAMLVVGRKR